jgi:hypothetical protein
MHDGKKNTRNLQMYPENQPVVPCDSSVFSDRMLLTTAASAAIRHTAEAGIPQPDTPIATTTDDEDDDDRENYDRPTTPWEAATLSPVPLNNDVYHANEDEDETDQDDLPATPDLLQELVRFDFSQEWSRCIRLHSAFRVHSAVHSGPVVGAKAHMAVPRAALFAPADPC